MIEKHVIACKLHPIQQSQRHVYFQFHNDGDEAREGFYMTKKVWLELGTPQVITVTVEAGDQIAERAEHEKNVLDRIPSSTPRTSMTFPDPAPVAPPVTP